MKKLALLMALLMALGAIALADSEYVWYGTMMVDNCEEWVSLRDGPGTGCGRLAKVPLYGIVTDAEWDPFCGDYIYCNYDGQYGYIMAKYLVPWADPEPMPDAWYTSGLGFSFYYDSSLWTVDEGMSEDGQDLMLYPADTDEPVYLEIMTAESIGVPTWKFLEVNATPETEYVEDLTNDGVDMHWFQKAADYNGDILQTYYTVDGPESALAAVATCPANEAVNWGAEFISIMRSIRFETPAPIRAEWSDGSGDSVVMDHTGAWVLLVPGKTLTQVQLLSLEFKDCDEDGNALYDTEVLYAQDALSPDAPLQVKIAFPGDMPCYGLRFTDASGQTRQFAIVMSGYDGSLVMEEF